jgi:glucose-6-phosphate 1-dehydrogenase
MFEPDRFTPQRSMVVIFGASGDLTRRKLAPALYNLEREGLLPDGTAVVGYGRTEMTDEAFREHLRRAVTEFSRAQPLSESAWGRLAGRTFYQQGAYDEAEGYGSLHSRLAQADKRLGTSGSRIYYLSVPPPLVTPILENLSNAGLLARQDRGAEDVGFHRVVFEKPFGHDLISARRLNNEIDRLLAERQIFRMDHYLGKETVQNISVLRFANSVFEHVWHSDSVCWIRVTVAETVGVEGRGAYFDQTGILRDILQNHVLQLLTLVTMEPPASLAADAIRDEKVKVLRCLRRLEGEEVRRSVIRGQHGRGVLDGKRVPAYREEEGVDPRSNTETFVGLRTYIDNWRWEGVPIYLCAGKRLAAKQCEVSVEFKEVPRVLFGAMRGVQLSPNRLTLRIQPDEGVSLRFTSKVPGIGLELKTVEMDFPYGSAFPAQSPEAYERLLLDVMGGNSALFTRRDEVEAAWEFATPILEDWESAAPPDFPNYEPGTWGPISHEQFFADDTAYCDAGRPR